MCSVVQYLVGIKGFELKALFILSKSEREVVSDFREIWFCTPFQARFVLFRLKKNDIDTQLILVKQRLSRFCAV